MSDQPTEILNSSGEGYLTWPQPFMTVEQLQAQIASLTAENERLKALIIRAYAEGFGDAWAIADDHLNQVAEYDVCWGLSHARAALQPKEGEQ